MDIESLTPLQQIKFQYWLNVFHECRESGLTNRAWCEQNNISLKSYYYWLAKLRKLAIEDIPKKEYVPSVRALSEKSISALSNSKPPTPSFVEISAVSTKPFQAAISGPAAVLKTGSISIELYENTSEAFLQMLIKAVQKC